MKRYTQQVIQADTADAAPLNSSVMRNQRLSKIQQLSFKERKLKAVNTSVRTYLLVVVLILQGCAGLLVEYKSEEKVYNISDHTKIFNHKKSDGECYLVSTHQDVNTYECGDDEEWGFVSIAFGVLIPIPYFHYDLRKTYVIENDVIREARYEKIRMFGALCGIIGGHDVFVPGCQINNEKYYQ